MRNRKANFTLIELLITISIIAILAAMLLPALNKARDKAMESSCTNNMKQSMLAIAQYIDDNDGWQPSHSQYPYINGEQFTWASFLKYGNYIPDFKAVRCPAMVFMGSNTLATNYFEIFGMRKDLETDGWFTIKKLIKPSVTVIIGDSAHEMTKGGLTYWRQGYYFRDSYPSAVKNYHLHLRHGAAANCGFADGHVVKLGAAELSQLDDGLNKITGCRNKSYTTIKF